MTSVVDTSVKHFHNVMVGAPVLSGTEGALIAVLDACLVTGFDTKSATSLVVAGGVATLAFSGSHSATVDSVVLVAGSSIAALNGEQKVTAIGAGVVRFATSEADATASGTITFKMAPAGWQKLFGGTNKAVYKSLDVLSTGMCIRIDDSGTTTARVVGYEAMTDVDTGTGPFPMPSQFALGGYLPKSSVASANAVKWNITADSRGVYLSVAGYSASNANAWGAVTRYMGDIISTKPGGDPYAFVIGITNSVTYSDMSGSIDNYSAGDQYTPRGFTGLGAAKAHVCTSYTGAASAASGRDNLFGLFPSEIDGGLRLARKYLYDTSVRGDFPGVFYCPQNYVGLYYGTNMVVRGTVGAEDRNLLTVSSTPSANTWPSNAIGALFFDITGPWR
jgi:hypothetical protein